ncbi:homoserine kinase [Oharaeibacter diazotrophicus]|uniref:Homoserine kinase n=1 Tax=Oharaeibacter diazotrophicus TaxID=1920512 RepID=A0A4R6RBA4_9HYPH|nr:homoserine kinase [Oharaeibacter diazotrophicus]TDP83400.1 homoserine kinase [Oharaeibacter diazotrophicus]BBE72233.1 homoserine kinase [Pleomorphomonas sp. SM30]GLS79001.1 homoserine kinase [Oharaeibacter diazotrophicus]
MAVYTEITDDDLAGFLAGYDLGRALSCKGIAEGVENSNYLLRTERGTFILTLYEKRTREEDLPFFLGLMQHLAARGITCPQPVKARDGGALGRIAGRPATIVTFLDGVWVKRPGVSHCRQVGEALAALHDAGADFAIPRANALTVGDWRPLFELSKPRADEVLPGLAAEIEAELDHLEAHWPRDLPRGVIHADLFCDNVFFLGGQLSGLIDFYFACNDFLAYDLAICLNAWCFEPDHAFNATKGRAMLSGYLAKRPLSEAETAALPLLARGSAMRFLLTRLYDWLTTPEGALVKKKDPLEYLRKLRFHRGVASIAAYGLPPEDYAI